MPDRQTHTPHRARAGADMQHTIPDGHHARNAPHHTRHTSRRHAPQRRTRYRSAGRVTAAGAAACTTDPCHAHASHGYPPSETSRGMRRRRRQRGCARRSVSLWCVPVVGRFPQPGCPCRAYVPHPRMTVFRGGGATTTSRSFWLSVYAVRRTLRAAEAVVRRMLCTADAPGGGCSVRQRLCPILSGECARTTCTSPRQSEKQVTPRHGHSGRTRSALVRTPHAGVCARVRIRRRREWCVWFAHVRPLRPRSVSSDQRLVTVAAAASAVPCARRGVRQRKTCAAQLCVCSLCGDAAAARTARLRTALPTRAVRTTADLRQGQRRHERSRVVCVSVKQSCSLCVHGWSWPPVRARAGRDLRSLHRSRGVRRSPYAVGGDRRIP